MIDLTKLRQDAMAESLAGMAGSVTVSRTAVIALIEAVQKAKAVAYSNGFDAALPDKLDALREALRPFTKE